MNLTSETILIISADLEIAKRCIDELGAFGGHYRTSTTISIEHARNWLETTTPAVMFLDESAIDSVSQSGSLESVVAYLTETAPVVVSAAPDRQRELSFLITAGAVDFVVRTGNFVSIAAGMLERRVRIASRISGVLQFPNEELAGDFGEILRHEVNNPLTGILGNTELLLARREGLPPAAIERLQTIAELAVRLREIVRRLSNSWEEKHEHAGPV